MKINRKSKNVTSLLLSLFVFLSILPMTPVHASGITSDVDAYLAETGMPQDVIDALDDELKQTIFESSNGEPKEFSSYQHLSYPEVSHGGIVPAGIPEDDFSISVVSFKESTKYNGYDQYSIYPSFEWKKETKIKNDKFGFSLPEGWETVPGSNKKNLVLYGHDYTTTSWSRAGSINTPCSAALTGYAFDGFDEHCLTSMYYKGNAFFYAYKKIPVPLIGYDSAIATIHPLQVTFPSVSA